MWIGSKQHWTESQVDRALHATSRGHGTILSISAGSDYGAQAH